MMPFLWNWAGKGVIKAFPWKWIIVGAVALFIGVAGWYAVYSYQGAIEDREKAVAEKQATEAELLAAKERESNLLHDRERLTEYMAAVEMQRQIAEAKLKSVATRKVKRDEKGDIAPDDPLLADLRGLFP